MQLRGTAMRRMGLIIAACLFLAANSVPALAEDIKLYVKNSEPIELYGDGKSYALVIGINEYKYQRKLTFAERDAKRVAAELERRGFDVTLYTDPNMTGRKLRTAIAEFVDDKGYEKDSRVLIWYAGHGSTVDGEGYLLGVDAPLLDTGAQTLDTDLKAFYDAAMPLRTFGVHLRQMRARHVLLVLDSCFAGTIFLNTRANPNLSLSREMAKPVRQIITAGDAGQEVADNGIFADMFIKAINNTEGPNRQTADQNSDGYLSGTELGQFLYSTVKAAGQTPQYGRLKRAIDINAVVSNRYSIKTDQLDLEKGEFFFVMPGAKFVNKPEDEETTPPGGGAMPVVWRELARGTRIANPNPDPVPVFGATPPAVGEKSFDLSPGQQFPPVGRDVVFEKATIAEKDWVRFKQNGVYYHVLASDIAINRPD